MLCFSIRVLLNLLHPPLKVVWDPANLSKWQEGDSVLKHFTFDQGTRHRRIRHYHLCQSAHACSHLQSKAVTLGGHSELRCNFANHLRSIEALVRTLVVKNDTVLDFLEPIHPILVIDILLFLGNFGLQIPDLCT